MRTIIQDLEYGCLVYQFFQNQQCFRAERGHFQQFNMC